MEIIHFTRKPRSLGNFSVEIYFSLIRLELKNLAEIKVLQCKYLSTGFLYRFYNAVEAALNQKDVNHILGDVTFLAAFLNRKKTIITFLDCNVLTAVTGWKYYLLKFFWFDMPVYKSVLITTISEATKQELIKYTNCPEEKIKVIYVSISDNFKKNDHVFNASLPKILHIGTAPNKNIDRLLEAIRDIPCELTIIGKVGDEIRVKLKNYKIQHILVEQHLKEEDVIQHYRDSDIVSFVSTYEGFGMPIIEANATGRCVITGNTTSMPEVAANAACLVNPYDVNEIKKGFLKIINNQDYREELIANGFENVKRFDKKVIAQQYLETYKEVFKKSKR